MFPAEESNVLVFKICVIFRCDLLMANLIPALFTQITLQKVAQIEGVLLTIVRNAYLILIQWHKTHQNFTSLYFVPISF